jgi:hypothetical protein
MSQSSQEIYVMDDSGLLSIVDTTQYVSFVSEEWTYEEIIQHFERQMQSRSLLIWECGDGGGNYSIEVRRTLSNEPGFREVIGCINASGGKLHIVSYDALTMAAQFEDETIPSKHDADTYINVEPGYYRVRVVQRFDPSRTTETSAPDFFIELELGEGPAWTTVPWLGT